MYYPPTGFYFRVQIPDLTGTSAAEDGENDVAFQDASGLSVEIATDDIPEGGQNRYKHRLPTGTKYGDLVLKRGYVYRSLPLFQWCQDTLQGGFAQRIEPKTVTLQLLRSSPSNADPLPVNPPPKPGAVEILRTWSFNNAWPTKWELSEFGAMKNEVVIESLRFAYRDFETE